MTKTQLIGLYKAAEKRATPCVGGRNGAGGVAFQVEDRIALVAAMQALGLNPNTAADAIVDGNYKIQGHSRVRSQFVVFERQVAEEVIRTGAVATGEFAGKSAQPQQDSLDFDGRIKSKQDVQPAFNRAAVQLIRIGITNPVEAVSFLTAGFEFAKSEQKVHMKTERLVQELQLGDLSRDQVMAVLDKVKAKF